MSVQPAVPLFEEIMFQLAAAFGQGAATMLVDVEGVRAVKSRFDEAIAAYGKERWSGDVLVGCEWARAVGRFAAYAATSRGHLSITSQDIGTAIETIDRIREAPFGACPFC